MPITYSQVVVTPTRGRAAPRSSRNRRAAAVVVASVAMALAAANASSAVAGVVRVASADSSDSPKSLTPTLIGPDGARRDLAPIAVRRGGAVERWLYPNPAGTFFAHATPSGLTLRGADGSRARALSGRAGQQEYPPTVWWNADGSSFAAGPVGAARDRSAIRWCTVRTLSCRLTPIGNREPIAALADGRVLEVAQQGALQPALSGRLENWAKRSARWVRHQRRLVNRRYTNKLWADSGPGGGRTVLRDLSRRASDRVTVLSAAAEGSPASTDGQILASADVRLRVETRTRNGRSQARVIRRLVRETYLRVTPDGSIRTVPGLAAKGVAPVAAVPGAGWVGLGPGRDGVRPPVRISLRGAVTPITLSGGPLSPQRLHDALGLPAADRPQDDPEFGSGEVDLVGFETQTGSAVVFYAEGDFVTAARVPLDGRPPTLVDRAKGVTVTYSVW